MPSYEINLDYLMSVNGHNDVFGTWWDRRNADLRYVLNSWQYDKYAALNYFYRPLRWNGKRIRSDALCSIMLSIDQAAGPCIP